MVLRKVNTNDIDLLIKLRLDYLTEDLGSLSQENWSKIKSQLESYFHKHIPDGTFIGVVAENNGVVLSTAYLAIFEKPANLAFITGKTGTLMNVLTYASYRRQGIATKVVSKIIEEAKLCGVCSIDLSATSDGKPLYQKLGFSETASLESIYTAMKQNIMSMS